jgi:hypothetical protein
MVERHPNSEYCSYSTQIQSIRPLRILARILFSSPSFFFVASDCWHQFTKITSGPLLDTSGHTVFRKQSFAR